MNNFETICFHESNSIINNYTIKENSLLNKFNNKFYNFNKIINTTKSTMYYNNILKELKLNSTLHKLDKFNDTYVIFGKSFDSNYKMTTLLFDIIKEFDVQAFPFKISLIEINGSGMYNFINNKKLNFNDEFISDFIIQRKYFDPIDYKYNEQIKKLKTTIEANLKNKTKHSFFIFNIENTFQKVRFYLLNELESITNKDFQPYIPNNLFLTSELSNLTLYLLDSYEKYSCVFKTTPLVQLIKLDIICSTNFKCLFGFIDNEKILDLADSFYQKILTNKKESRLVLYKNPEPIKMYSPKLNTIKPTIAINDNVYKFKSITPKSEDLNKINNQLVKYSNPLGSPKFINPKPFYPSTPTNTPTQSEYNKIKKQNMEKNLEPLKLNSYSDTKKMELIKYIPSELKPSQIYDRLCILNKFVFNSTVKNQLKLQRGYREPEKMEEINKDLIIHMKSLLTVVLDQINQL